MTFQKCSVCKNGWRMSPLNWGKSGYARQLLCPTHLAEVRAAEDEARKAKRS